MGGDFELLDVDGAPPETWNYHSGRLWEPESHPSFGEGMGYFPGDSSRGNWPSTGGHYHRVSDRDYKFAVLAFHEAKPLNAGPRILKRPSVKHSMLV
jgi:hypothetical protein